jgi:CreA protein
MAFEKTPRMAEIGFERTVTLAQSVRSMDAAIAWYERVLGFKLAYRVDEIGWCEMETPVNGVFLGLSESENPNPARDLTPTWSVTDIDSARAQLEAHDVRFDGPTRTIDGMVSLATFYDPDGNPFMLAQNLSEQ